jgi:phosphonate transport system ATP-binding protein
VTSASIEVRGLTKHYGPGAVALAGLDLHIEAGELVALVGSNGSGKSTLFRCLLRLVEPTAGVIRIGDCEVTSADRRRLRELRSSVGVVFQRLHLVPRLSVFHNVLLGAMGRTGPRGWWPALATAEQRADAMTHLERVDLAEFARRRVDALSGGQQQRVAIARMLMQRPVVVLADEPVSSLDPAAGISVMELLHDIAREQRLTTVVSLHQVDYAFRFSDRLIGLRTGSIAIDARTGDLTPEGLAELYQPVAA